MREKDGGIAVAPDLYKYWKNIKYEKECTFDVFVEDYVNNYFPDMPDLKLITELSFAPYEKDTCKNKTLLFIPISQEDALADRIVPIKYEKYNRVTLESDKDNIKAIRKLLQSLGTQKKFSLAFIFENRKGRNSTRLKNYEAMGIVQRKNNEAYDEKLFGYVVEIVKPAEWKMSIFFGGKTVNLFGYSKGQFCKYRKENEERSPKVSCKSRKPLCKNCPVRGGKVQEINSAFCQSHGTSAVFFANAEDANNEAKRLSEASRGTYNKNGRIEMQDICDSIAAIDGGFIFDTTGKLYAYGVIFDGTVVDKYIGEIGKGSRHNSVRLYIHNWNKRVGVDKQVHGEAYGSVFSEDGGYVIYCKNNLP